MSWSILGHTPAITALDRALASDRPADAWAFIGPEGVGKRATAIEFAAALNCEGPGAPIAGGLGLLLDTPAAVSKPCGVCRPCRDTLAGRHPDVEIIEPGGMCDEPDHRDHADSRDLRICQIRRLMRILNRSAYNGGLRIAIVDAADSLHVEAANAFLKTLEEPPPGSVIILLVEREERLPETVFSRCQKVPFRPVDRDVIVQALLQREVEPVQAEAIAGAAAGRLGWAIRAVEDPSMLTERGEMLDQAYRIAHAGRFERFTWAKQPEGGRANESKERYQRELRVWEGWWRDVLVASSGTLEGAINIDRASILADEGRLYEKADIVRFLKKLMETREYLYSNVDAQLALENLTLDLPEPVGRAR